MTRLPSLLSFFFIPVEQPQKKLHTRSWCLTQNKRTAVLSRRHSVFSIQKNNFLDGNGPPFRGMFHRGGGGFDAGISLRSVLVEGVWCESKLARLFGDTRPHVFECERVRSLTRREMRTYRGRIGGIYVLESRPNIAIINGRKRNDRFVNWLYFVLNVFMNKY